MTCTVLDGVLFRDLIFSAQRYLGQHKKEIDALNVFPVPDGDTGTNMYLTISSAAEKLGQVEKPTLSEAAEMASMGALMGARGNSGVILSQIFRGIAKSFAGKETADAQGLAEALNEAVTTAYKAVMKPVEGTILTVLKGVRDTAISSASSGSSIPELLEKSLKKAKEVLAKTPELLPVLKQAGVVDAGGKGLVYILEGALCAFSEKDLDRKTDGVNVSSSRQTVLVTAEEIEDIINPYDTQFLLAGKNIPINELRAKLESYGDSLLVVGSENLARIHIHTQRPGEVLTLCLKYGSLSQVTIDNMIEQSRRATVLRAEVFEKAASGERPVVQSSGDKPYPQLPTTREPRKETGIVSVATGEGFKEIMKSLGCDLVIDGGATMNPSTSELAKAVKTVNAKKIIFLPNNGNIFLAAKQAKKLTGRNMYVVPSKTIPQGISALLALNLNEDMEHNLKRAAKAVRRVKTGEITFAARNGKFGKHIMKKGDILGLIDGKVEAVGQNPEEVLKKIIKSMVRKDDAVITIYYGLDANPSFGMKAVDELKAELGDGFEFEVHNGGQPLYYYIVSVE